jgi:hypothetical protein
MCSTMVVPRHVSRRLTRRNAWWWNPRSPPSRRRPRPAPPRDGALPLHPGGVRRGPS